MINFIEKNNKLDLNVNSLNITYSRTINIIYGNYPYPHIIHNFILDLKNNLDQMFVLNHVTVNLM